ncbi:hypothetical protein Ancab_018649, partial [Ancistrocladus abbreviatus]
IVIEGCEKCPGSCGYEPNGTHHCLAHDKKHHLTLGTIIGESIQLAGGVQWIGKSIRYQLVFQSTKGLEGSSNSGG